MHAHARTNAIRTRLSWRRSPRLIIFLSWVIRSWEFLFDVEKRTIFPSIFITSTNINRGQRFRYNIFLILYTQGHSNHSCPITPVSCLWFQPAAGPWRCLEVFRPGGLGSFSKDGCCRGEVQSRPPDPFLYWTQQGTVRTVAGRFQSKIGDTDGLKSYLCTGNSL